MAACSNASLAATYAVDRARRCAMPRRASGQRSARPVARRYASQIACGSLPPAGATPGSSLGSVGGVSTAAVSSGLAATSGPPRPLGAGAFGVECSARTGGGVTTHGAITVHSSCPRASRPDRGFGALPGPAVCMSTTTSPDAGTTGACSVAATARRPSPPASGQGPSRPAGSSRAAGPVYGGTADGCRRPLFVVPQYLVRISTRLRCVSYMTQTYMTQTGMWMGCLSPNGSVHFAVLAKWLRRLVNDVLPAADPPGGIPQRGPVDVAGRDQLAQPAVDRLGAVAAPGDQVGDTDAPVVGLAQEVAHQALGLPAEPVVVEHRVDDRVRMGPVLNGADDGARGLWRSRARGRQGWWGT